MFYVYESEGLTGEGGRRWLAGSAAGGQGLYAQPSSNPPTITGRSVALCPRGEATLVQARIRTVLLPLGPKHKGHARCPRGGRGARVGANQSDSPVPAGAGSRGGG